MYYVWADATNIHKIPTGSDSENVGIGSHEIVTEMESGAKQHNQNKSHPISNYVWNIVQL